jgi:hypothetical protein
MKSYTKATIILVIICLAVIWLPPMIIELFNDPSTQSQVTVKGEWCYLKTIQTGETIQENNAGVYEYQIYATQKGIEVWTPCP